MKNLIELENAINAWQIGVDHLQDELQFWPSALGYNQLEYYKFHIEKLSKVRDSLISSNSAQVELGIRQEFEEAKAKLEVEKKRLAQLFSGEEEIHNSRTSVFNTLIQLLGFILD